MVARKKKKKTTKKRTSARKKPASKRSTKKARAKAKDKSEKKRPAIKAAYLVGLAMKGTDRAAREHVETILKETVSRTAVWDWKQTDKFFAEQCKAAESDWVDMLEEEAARRAVEGVNEPRTVAGKKVMVKKYSDGLLLAILKAKRGEQYREHLDLRHTGKIDTGEASALAKIIGADPDLVDGIHDALRSYRDQHTGDSGDDGD